MVDRAVRQLTTMICFTQIESPRKAGQDQGPKAVAHTRFSILDVAQEWEAKLAGFCHAPHLRGGWRGTLFYRHYFAGLPYLG